MLNDKFLNFGSTLHMQARLPDSFRCLNVPNTVFVHDFIWRCT